MSQTDATAVLLDELLRPRLGHGITASAHRLRQTLRAIADERGAEEAALLRQLMRQPDRTTLERLLDAATVHHTAFYRHPEHFEALEHRLARHRSAGGPFRIWSAGCATGEEPYTLALTADKLGVEAFIVATDVSPAAIRTARTGHYAARRAKGVPGADPESGWTAPERVKRMIRFQVASLVDADPVPGGARFDVIFCRNVLLYFEREEAAAVLDKLAARLTEGGAIVVAPAETLIPLPQRLEHADPVGWIQHRAKKPERTAQPPPPRPAPAATREQRLATPPPRPLDDAARALGAGELRHAEATLRDWIDGHPDDGKAWFLLGEVLFQRGEVAQARASFARAAQCAERTSRDPDAATLAQAARRRARP